MPLTFGEWSVGSTKKQIYVRKHIQDKKKV